MITLSPFSLTSSAKKPLPLISWLGVAPMLAGAQSTPSARWTPLILTDSAVQRQHYLPDFSYACYHWGETPIPRHAPTLDQHAGANHQNLFDDITLYEDSPAHLFIYRGGDGYRAPTHGAFSTL